MSVNADEWVRSSDDVSRLRNMLLNGPVIFQEGLATFDDSEVNVTHVGGIVFTSGQEYAVL